MNQNKKTAIIGAGRLGKGFLGEAFLSSAYDVTFFDNDKDVIKELAKGSYDVDIHYAMCSKKKTFTNYSVHCIAHDFNSVSLLAENDIFAIAIYPEDFAGLYAMLADALSQRICNKKKTSILVFTNVCNFAEVVEKNIKSYLSPRFNNVFHQFVEVKETVIIRSTFAKDSASLELQTLAIKDSIIAKLQFHDISDVGGMVEAEHLNILKKVKIYTLNGPHAATAYSGFYKGYLTINDAENDEFCANIAKGVSELANKIVRLEYPLSNQDIAKISLTQSTYSPIVDSISRVAFDPIRKLGRNDRLVYPVIVANKHGLDFNANAKAIALGFLYDNPEDDHSIIIQKYIKDFGIEKAVVHFCSLQEDEKAILQTIIQYYDEFKKEII